MNDIHARPLFVFEMANNHMGRVEHGLRIIRALRRVAEGFPFHFAVKLQYRELDSFIHPDFQNRTDIKYVKRFRETRLSEEQFLQLKKAIDDAGLFSMCTPFDEPSADRAEKHDFDIVKIASCSFTDWPLLERVAAIHKPIIASAAGASLDDMDKVVSFFEHRATDLTLMHCVAEYPTADARLQLHQIDLFRQRYPNVHVGYSTHENPDNIEAIQIAVAKGAVVFEKHVGIPTDAMPLNAYSANPDQLSHWLEAARRAYAACGAPAGRAPFAEAELASLRSLRRGAFAKRPLSTGERIRPADVFLAIPVQDRQLTANDMSKYLEIHAQSEIPERAPLLETNTTRRDVRASVYDAVQRVKQLLRDSGVAIPPKVELEISHHYGIDRFDEFGLTMLTVVNRQYCKKLMILLPGQQHPEQHHREKEETFNVLYGDVWVALSGETTRHGTGDVVTVERGVKHSFGTKSGAVIEEISSSHRIDDSFYTDPAIMANKDRKTLLTYWLD